MDARLVLAVNLAVVTVAAVLLTAGVGGWSAVFGVVALVCAAVVLTAYVLGRFRNGGAR